MGARQHLSSCPISSEDHTHPWMSLAWSAPTGDCELRTPSAWASVLVKTVPSPLFTDLSICLLGVLHLWAHEPLHPVLCNSFLYVTILVLISDR
jgi:hypothetical protein